MNNLFKYAVVRKPCPEMVDGITTANLGKPDYNLALGQHARYVEIVETCGLKVTVLESDSRYPDSTFIEDVAVCIPQCAVITNPGAPSRNGEKETIHPVLHQFYERIEEICFPGTLDGGDVMMAGSRFYIGLSSRTNSEGAGQLIRILGKYGLEGSTVPLKNTLHLKTGISYLEENTILVTGELAGHTAFKNYRRIIVPPNESYAANSLWINGKILIPVGYPETAHKLEQAGYPIRTTDVSEFRKLDGGLSCLSLRF